MTNLAPVLAKIQGALANTSEKGITLASGALIVSKRSEKGAEIAYIKAESIFEVISFDEYEALAEKGFLYDDGKSVVMRAGSGRRVKTIGILLDDLRRAVTRVSLESNRILALEERNKELEKQLRLSHHAHASEAALATLLDGIREKISKKGISQIGKGISFSRSKPARGRALAGVPTLFLSDWHVGEVVDPEQVQYLNEYDLDIAFRRADRVFSTALELLFHHQAGQSYDGITLAFGGDMLSGNIHDELRRTNEKGVLDCVMDLANSLVGNIIEVAKNFEWVYVPCVAGNHGRIDHKPTSKDAVKDNFDTHVYKLVAALVQAKLGDKCNVQFDISESLDMRFDIYGTRYLLTHGDQIDFSAKNGQFWPSLMDTVMKKQAREVKAGGSGFDYMLCGHFHRYGTVSNLIVNGSLKGYDEWVYRKNYEQELPVQAMWITHPDYGIIEHRPVYAEIAVADSTLGAQPVTTYPNGIRRYR